MGAIYLATDRETGRQVAVKTLVDYFDTSDTRQVAAARERLAQEAETLAQLRHGCIPRTLGVCEDGAQLFLVMEYIVGADLDQRLSRSTPAVYAGQPFALADVLRWGVALCRVLEYLAAQPQPVIHHDIKPANVLVDPAADTIHLVDFGTARVRLDPHGDVGLAQSSLYGTVGYAPPEQYRGRSELRSDVYALAATLYHLASDDDPADHPFSFPKLGALGALGAALGDALDREVERRPTAAQLRRRLEALLAPAGVALLRAPDGTWLPDKEALVAWCLREWSRAAEWLRNGMPEQIARWWEAGPLAAELRQLVEREPNPDVALDRALALIDPEGQGREQPRVVSDAARLDFGTLPGSVVRRDITIENTSRRYVALYIFLPRWLGGRSGLLALPPGRRTMLSLAPDLSRVYIGGRLRGHVLVRDHYGRRAADVPLLRVPVQASVPRRYILRRYGLPLGGTGLALLVWLGAGLPLPQEPSPALPALLAEADARAELPLTDEASLLKTARQQLEERNYQAARTTLITALQRGGESVAVRSQLNEVFYQESKQLIDQGNWQGARAVLEPLLATAPGYRDAEELLVRTYRRAAQSAADRGDLAGAQMELEALLARSLSEAQDETLHRTLVERQAQLAVDAQDWDGAAQRVLALWALDPANRTAASLVASNGELGRTVIAYQRATWASGRAYSPLRILGGPQGKLALSPDGAMLALLESDGKVRIHNTANGAIESTLEDAIQGEVHRLLFSPDGERLVVQRGTGISIWRTRDGGGMGSMDGFSPISSIAFAADNRIVIRTATGFQVVDVGERGTSIQESRVPATVDDASQAVALIEVDGSVRVWETDPNPAYTYLSGTNAAAVSLSADGSTVAVLDADGAVTLYRPAP